MSLPPPRLAVVPTGNPGEVVIQLEGPDSPIRVFNWLDTPMPDGVFPSVHYQDFRGPGQFVTSGFLNGIWHSFCAVYLDTPELASGPSRIVKAQPNSPLPAYSVDLRRLDQQILVPGRTCGFRFKVEAINPKNMSAAIFLYSREPFENGTEFTRDVFKAVCKTGDFVYPEHDPALGGTLFRLNYVDLVERSDEHVEETWNAIFDDVDELISGLEILATMETA